MVKYRGTQISEDITRVFNTRPAVGNIGGKAVIHTVHSPY